MYESRHTGLVADDDPFRSASRTGDSVALPLPGQMRSAGRACTVGLASDNAEPQSVNLQDLCKAGECRLCTQRLQNDFGNDSDPSLQSGVVDW